tara:strand:- start:227 stop:490 length:264 start_codon:yes stop_codon:yes gene_type:complete
MESANYTAQINGSANMQPLPNGPTGPTGPNGWSSGPPLMSDEKIFEWEYKETQNTISPDDEGYRYYKNLKARYIFEVTNWFQPPLNS